MCYLEFNKSIIRNLYVLFDLWESVGKDIHKSEQAGDGILMVIWKREGDHEPTRQGSNPWPSTHKTNALTNWVTRPNENFKQRNNKIKKQNENFERKYK